MRQGICVRSVRINELMLYGSFILAFLNLKNHNLEAVLQYEMM